MTPRPTPSTRIGDTERSEAQRMLQGHLDAGRLQVAEFVERFSRAADAVTAADIAALFADLPAPHPTLPRPPLGPQRRSLVMAAVAVLLAGLLGFVIGRGLAAPGSPPGAVAAPGIGPITPSGELPGPPTGSAGALPGNPTLRRTTGPGLITLRQSDGVDLDDTTSPTWNVGSGCCGRDVGFAADAAGLSLDGGHAAVTGPLEFATCLHATYTDSPVERGRLYPGETFCVRTNEHRFALVTIVDVTEQAVGFGATVWDPPVP